MSEAIHTDNPAIRGLPANVTFHDLIRRNKRRSALLMVGMGLLVVLVGVAVTIIIGMYTGFARDEVNLVQSLILGAAASALVATVAGVWSFYGGSSAILAISGAREIAKKDDPQLYNVVEEIAIAAGVPPPKVYLIDDTALNAFATGRDPQHAAVAITKGLRAQLSRDELAGVMAHEMSHIRFYDIRFAMLMATMVGLIVFASDAVLQMMRLHFWYGGGRRGSRRSGDNKGAAIIMLVVFVISIILMIIAPTLAMLIRMAVSREREYLADAGAVELTRYPQGLISALNKLGACREPLEVANRATSHLYIVNPMKQALKGRGHELNSVFRTHPPLHDRIARLSALIAAPAAAADKPKPRPSERRDGRA
ncbi:MAG: M48 family metallopeptidase [Phycisphaerales bacterium]|nr:M48 family metallopeptidase [Phycisphaerales bacterium]